MNTPPSIVYLCARREVSTLVKNTKVNHSPARLPLKIDEALRISGLTRDQLHSMMRNYCWTPHAPTRQGSAREFTTADVFELSVAGVLSGFGLNMRAIVSALGDIPPSLNADFTQTEIFPGWLNGKATGTPIYLVFKRDRSGEIRAEFTANFNKLDNGIVLNASRLATAIEAAAQL